MAPTLMHMGSLHPIEQAIVLLAAFGPFVILAIVVAVRARNEGDGEGDSATSHDDAEPDCP